jgi:hypothetical protein
MITNWFVKWLENKRAKHAQLEYENKYTNSLKEKALQGISIQTGIIGTRDMTAGRLDAYPDLSFKMYSAENGYVMEVRHTDRKTERQSVNLHVITDDQDLGEAIAHILTVESLKIK